MQTVEMGWAEEREGSHRCSSYPSGCNSSKGSGCKPAGQTSGAETATGPGEPAHIEAKPRVRSRKTVQRVAVLDKLPSLEKKKL